MKPNDLKKLIQERISVVLEQEAGIEQLVPQLRTLLDQIPESQLSDEVKPMAVKLVKYCKNHLGFERPPKLFLKQDLENSQNTLGRTAHYNPGDESITLFTTSRHPKDILRSLAHELVHHHQNLRGDLSPEKIGK